MLAAFPLLVVPVAFYNILMLTISGGFTGAGAGARLSTPLVNLHMVSRALWPVSLGDLLLTGSLLILFAELLKSAGSRRITTSHSTIGPVPDIVRPEGEAVSGTTSR